jgi:hypothetical protein
LLATFINKNVHIVLFKGAASFKQSSTDSSLPRSKSDETVGNGTENSEHKVSDEKYKNGSLRKLYTQMLSCRLTAIS